MKSISENLIRIGVARTTAKVVEFLNDGESGTSKTLREIERGCDLRQPEVSIAIKSLVGYVKVSGSKTPSRGRPTKIISMPKENYKRYIDFVTEDAQKSYDDVIGSIVELKGCV